MAGDGPQLDGIVFDTPSTTKVVVAVVDRGRGPVFRTVHPRTLSERTAEGADDRALRLLIRRTPAAGAAAPRRWDGRPASGRIRRTTARRDAPHDAASRDRRRRGFDEDRDAGRRAAAGLRRALGALEGTDLDALRRAVAGGSSAAA